MFSILSYLRKLLALILVLLLAACASVTPVTSSPEKEPKNGYRFYDAESKVRYHVSNDAENLYITLNTAEPASILKIMRTGLWIYFDVEGKKHRNVFVQYPLMDAEGATFNEEDEENNPMQNPLRLQHEIEELRMEAIYNNGKTQDLITTLGSGIQVVLTAPSPQEITYRIQMPFSKISDIPFSDLQKLSVGIVSGGLENKVVRKTRPSNASMQNNQMPGMQNAGPNGNLMGGQLGGADFSGLTVPIEFWLNITLYRP